MQRVSYYWISLIHDIQKQFEAFKPLEEGIQTDMRINSAFIELCLEYEKINYERILYNDSKENDETEMTPVAEY